MFGSLRPHRTAAYKPALAWTAALGAGWVFVPVVLGAFTTSIGAGMVFPDWPLSNGSLNPTGWLQNVAMFAEHSHRLSVGIMTTITLLLALALWWSEARRWLRRLGGVAVALVFLQALVGGLRVLLNPVAATAIDTNVGQLFAMLHAVLAQVYVCVFLGIAVALSRAWMLAPPRREPRLGGRLPRLELVGCGLLLAQLAIAAVMRHSFAGLAIPTFPLMPDGGLLPRHWDFGVGLNFAHRIVAFALAVALGWLAARVWRDRAAGRGEKLLALGMVLLLATQIALGASVIWSGRNVYVTTAHVLVGALTTVTTFLLIWLRSREELEGSALECLATEAPSGTDRTLTAAGVLLRGADRPDAPASIHA